MDTIDVAYEQQRLANATAGERGHEVAGFVSPPLTRLMAEPGPGDDDDEDEPAKVPDNGGNIDPDDDEGSGDDDDDDDDEDTIWTVQCMRALTVSRLPQIDAALQRRSEINLAAVQHRVL